MIIKKLVELSIFSMISFSLVAQESQPNFIVIMADDLGYGDLGV